MMEKYNLYNQYSNKYKINGNKFSFSMFNDVDNCYDYTTQYKEQNGYINPSSFDVKTKKIINNNYYGYNDYDEVEETIYTIYRQTAENDNGRVYGVITILGKRKIVEYKKNKKYHRLNGPAIEDFGFVYDGCLFSSDKIEIYYQNGILLPDWLPKINDNKINLDINKAMLLKIALKFDANYAKLIELVYGKCEK